MFTPSKQELEELGFEENNNYYCNIFWNHMVWIVWNIDKREWTIESVPFYPQSLDDLKTLIRLLTPPWA